MLSHCSPSRPRCTASASTEAAFWGCYTRWTLDFRYIAIEGPLGVGKSALADQLGARFDATVVLDETDNPFLADFYAERPGSGFQTQLFYTLGRHRQQTSLRQRGPLQPAHDLRLPVRARQDLRLPEPRRQRALHLPAAVRPARARPAVAGSRRSTCRRRPTSCAAACASGRAPKATRPSPKTAT